MIILLYNNCLLSHSQNDKGSTNPATDGSHFFTTYMKARIFCEREVPPGREYVGAIDYKYNVIREYPLLQTLFYRMKVLRIMVHFKVFISDIVIYI